MDLTAMVRVVQEKVREDQTTQQALRFAIHAAVVKIIAQPVSRNRFVDHSDDSAVLSRSCIGERREIRAYLVVERWDRVCLAGQAPQPDPVRRKQVIESPVNRAESTCAWGEVLFIREDAARFIEPLIGPNRPAC